MLELPTLEVFATFLAKFFPKISEIFEPYCKIQDEDSERHGLEKHDAAVPARHSPPIRIWQGASHQRTEPQTAIVGGPLLSAL